MITTMMNKEEEEWDKFHFLINKNKVLQESIESPDWYLFTYLQLVSYDLD